MAGRGALDIVYHHRTRGEDAQGIHIQALVDALRDQGHRVRLIGPPRLPGGGDGGQEKSGRLRRRLRSLGYELLALGYNGPAFFRLVLAMARQRPDMVYERYALYAVAGRLAAGLFQVPFVLEVNAPLCLEMDRENGLELRPLARAMENWLFRKASRTIVVSKVMARILENQGAPAERLVVMPNGVDGQLFHPGVDGAAVRRHFGLADRFVVGFVGWVRPWHGVDRLLAAIARLAEDRSGLHLLIVGDGPAMPDLLETAEDLGIRDRVHFTGALAQEAIPRHIAAMDVAVQPDVTEYASPIKLFEYLAMGRPVMAPRKANIEEVVTDGDEALLFHPGDTDDMADCLARLHDDPALRGHLADRAQRLVGQRDYFWSGNARKVAALVQAPEERPA